MSYNRARALFLVAFVLFHVSNPLAQAQLRPGMTVTGNLFRTPTGNSPGPPLADTVVNVICNVVGVSTIVGRNTTNADGSFIIYVFAAVQGLSLGSPTVPCLATVRLPQNSTVFPMLSTATRMPTVSAYAPALASSLQSYGYLSASNAGMYDAVAFVNLTV